MYLDKSIEELNKLLKEKKIKPIDLVEEAFERIEQDKELNALLDEIKELEMKNIKTLEHNMKNVQAELKKTQQTEKIQQAYDFDENQSGNIINIQD